MAGNSTAPRVQRPYIISTTFGAPLDDRCSISSIANIDTELPLPLRFKGLMVYVENKNRIYWFTGGTANSNFVEFKTFYSVSTLAFLGTELPLSNRFLGQMFYVADLMEYYWFKSDLNTPVPFATGSGGSSSAILIDTLIVNNYTEYQHNLNTKNLIVSLHHNNDDMQNIQIEWHLGRIDNSIYSPIDAESFRKNYVTIHSTLQNFQSKLKIMTL